jgi:crotonobetainyl-CoA:carnitine CoA-transferase CaiB-like acyl-CoA transferase
MQPFEEVDVLDLTQSIAGPISTQFLGTLGANVVKVEPPGGDAFRGLLGGSMFASVNLGGKRSVALDLKTEDGQTAARKLAERADVVVESFRPGVVEQFGLDYDSVSAINEDVVYLSLTGFGQDGPHADWPAYDPVVQAMSGLMSVIGYKDRPPVRIGASIIDYGTGTTAAFLLASALIEREQTGEGTELDISLFEVAVSWMGYWIAYYTSTGEVPERSGQGFAGLAPNEVFHAANDEPFYLSVVNDRLYERLCHSLDREDLLTDERFATNSARWEHRNALRAELSAEFKQYDREELTALLAEAGVPTGPLQTVDELTEEDPQVAARDLLTDTYNLWKDTPARTASAPYRADGERPELGERPPAKGEHTRTVLAELGFTDSEIEQLVKEDVAHETTHSPQ